MMESAHNTLESQQILKKRGTAVVLALIVALACYVVYQISQGDQAAADHAEEGTEQTGHPAERHGETDHEAPHDEEDHDETAVPHEEHHGEEKKAEDHGHAGEKPPVPACYSVIPFVALLLCIAILPLFHKTEHWWEKNSNRFLVAAGLGIVTLLYYAFLHGHGAPDHLAPDHLAHGHTYSEPGIPAALTVLKNALMGEYIPFITLLFSLYVISGGIAIDARIVGKPHVNTAIIGLGAFLASFVGTTGAAMLLIRPLLAANVKREYVSHTVIFFIFAVCNTGGCLLPIGDPPLFLGYLRGVSFFWTLKLWPMWLMANLLILAIYFVWDTIAVRKEHAEALIVEKTDGPKLKTFGSLNLLWLIGIVVCVATLDPAKPFPGTEWHAPRYFREMLMLLLTLASLVTTEAATRMKNSFNYEAILEVAALFSGIFICMQAPVEILNVYGDSLGIDSSMKFFWFTGVLSSFLDNAPTYVVFFETAKTMEPVGTTMAGVSESYLIAISLGSVFMGAMTYIGNGPNFMVKAIAEKNNIRMPSFFGYAIYSTLVLAPTFLLVTLVFL